MSSPSDRAADPWPEPAAFEANADGHLTPGQRQMLLGGPVLPPYVSLGIVTAAICAGAVLWWRFGFGIGITVILVGSNIGLAAMGTNFQQRRHGRRMRSALDHPAIGRGIGEVAVTGSRVDIRSGVRPIDLGPAAPGAPPAGWYQMYWLEHRGAQRWNADRILLSARPVPRPPAPVDDRTDPGHDLDPLVASEVSTRLRQVLPRTGWELRFNRAGALSPPQLAELRQRARRRVWARLVGVTVGSLIGGLMLLAALIAWRRTPSGDESDTAGGIFSLCVGLVVLWFTVRTVIRLPEAMAWVNHPPPLARASGPVTVKLEDSENNTWTVAMEDGPTFTVTADVARAFGTPVPYTAYYVVLAGDHILLAAEPGLGGDEGAGAVHGWPRPDWVTANAAGRLTPAQQGQIVGEPIRWKSTFMVVFVALVVVASAAVPYISHHFQPKRIVVGDGTELIVIVSIAATVVAGWAGFMLWRVTGRRRRSAVVLVPEITASTGEIVWSGGTYRVSGTPVPLRLPSGVVLPEPGPYRFYWLRAPGPTLLSAEPYRREPYPAQPSRQPSP
ncbi:MAG TPA: hypothetical protein VKB69_04985 [Micromonosporaceae bacterium]|nr:hypothetical protein [Micromonosporaceae bacterium]